MAHETAEMQLQELVDGLGSTLADALLGDVRGSARLVLAGEQGLDGTAQETVAVAHEVFTLLKEYEGSDTARAWFVGTNTMLDISQITALREGHFDAVRATARGLIEDIPASAL